jgi:hypothetical protein
MRASGLIGLVRALFDPVIGPRLTGDATSLLH